MAGIGGSGYAWTREETASLIKQYVEEGKRGEEIKVPNREPAAITSKIQRLKNNGGIHANQRRRLNPEPAMPTTTNSGGISHVHNVSPVGKPNNLQVLRNLIAPVQVAQIQPPIATINNNYVYIEGTIYLLIKKSNTINNKDKKKKKKKNRNEITKII
jgi:hypothetical protein